MAQPGPLVALAGGIDRHSVAGDLKVPANYLRAIERAGGIPVVLYPVEVDEDNARARLSPFDGLLLMGGGDIDPARYGQTPGQHLYGVNGTRDAFEVALLRAAQELRMPTLAICRGLQMVNVARGGTLDQHISDRDDLEGHGVPGGGEPALHGIRVDPASHLCTMLGSQRLTGSCHHHQAVATLGAGLKPVAWADDGIVEALEDPAADLIAVQWHPEDTASEDPTQQRLFDAWLEHLRASAALLRA